MTGVVTMYMYAVDQDPVYMYVNCTEIVVQLVCTHVHVGVDVITDTNLICLLTCSDLIESFLDAMHKTG